MFQPTYHNVHNRFKLNGFHLNKEDLCRVAYSFIKEGDDFEKPVGDFILDWFDDKSYIEMLTSGSTGIPKLIRVEKQAMVSSALATGDFFGLEAGNQILHCLPVKYVAGKMMFVRGFILGLEVDFIAPNAKPLELIDKTYDFAAMVPLQAKNSLDKLHLFKQIIIGGAKIPTNLKNELLKVDANIYETFGMTETVSHIAARRIDETAFTVFPDVMLTIDENSCLVIHAPKISEEVIQTNDIVKLVSENQFEFLGRLDNIINSGGVKLIPEIIEEKLAPFIPKRFFVIGKEDANLGEKLVLVVEGEPIEIDFTKIETLDKFEKPKEIYFVPKFEETPTSKIIRKETFALV